MSKSRPATQHGLIPLEIIERRIYFIRTHKVMLDSDLAELYGVTTKRLNEQVKRNIDRFPADFMFRLNQQESDRLRSQFATSKQWTNMTVFRYFSIGLFTRPRLLHLYLH